MTPDEFRRLGHRVIDWIADYRETIESRPVAPPTSPGEVRKALPVSPPELGESFDGMFHDLDQFIAPNLVHWQHPRFFGYFPGNASLESVLGDFLSTGLGVVGLSWQAAPALAEVEEVVTDWVRQAIGLSGVWQGVIHDTASTATLVALFCARERSTGFGLARGGMQAEPHPLVVYASAQSHSSVDKAALLAGFGRENVHLVPCDAAHAMLPDALDLAMRADRDAGRVPCAVVATTGTTATTAFDPIDAIVAVARTHGAWVHVDGAMAGSAMILPECRPLWEGVEGADSVVLNPHKWLGVVFDASLFYVRDSEHLVRVMGTNPSYLQSAVDGEVRNLRDWGIPLGRRFRALKLWALLRGQGLEALRSRLRRDLDNAQWLARQVEATPGWRVVVPVRLQTVCVRHEPPGMDADALDAHARALCDAINRSGVAYLTAASVNGEWIARVSIGAEMTEREHVATLWEAMRAEATKP
ncbi:MAG: aspartate aminotransferase family protein [Chloroflexi bacterium]|nr:MAG: aspartate aminotransferase family protein [Chloroflexota bacterium]